MIPVTTGAVVLESDIDHRDNTYADADNIPLGYTGGRKLANASAAFESDHHWLVRAWVRNLTNKFYNTGFGFHPVVDRVSYGVPRTYGLTVEWRVR